MRTRKQHRNRLRNKNINHHTYHEDLPDYLKLWIFRILWDLGGYREFFNPFGFSDDSVALAIGLGEWDDTSDSQIEQNKINRQKLCDLYLSEIDFLDPVVCNEVLTSNIKNVAQIAHLDETDCRLLEFSILLQSEQMLIQATDCLGNLSLAKSCHVLSVILDLPLESIKVSLKQNSVLARTGLVSLNSTGSESLERKLEVVSTNFADLAMSEVMDPVALLRGQLVPATAPGLALDDFDHLDKHLHVLLPYLGKVKKVSRPGVNILLYGQPGTGKTQLVKVLAQCLHSELYEVASEDEDGDAVKGANRLKTYQAAQAFLASRDVFHVFEEIEDIFPDNHASLFGGNNQASGISKAWINRTLEENNIPTFWVSNSISCLDPAYTRRFDFVIEMPVPPRKQREKIINSVCNGLVSDSCINRLAESEKVAPAVIARVASVVRSIKDELAAQSIPASIEMMVESTLKAQGHRVKIADTGCQLPGYYDPAFINTEIDLNKLASGLVKNKNCRICLYGPPGTGKTAYGYWLAKKLEMPIIVKRVSDLQSPYLGEAEMNIAAAFQQATLDESILLIDEVDSFLQDRRSAKRSWEISQVNEFLTQMENYSGIFIASTNLMDGLDQAAMRRFDIKACFAYLKPEQAWQMFRKQCKLQSIPTRNKGLREKLDQLTVLTPGDFTVIVRSNRFEPVKDAWQMLERLEKECSHKQPNHAPIGFM